MPSRKIPPYPRKPHASGQVRIVLDGRTYYFGRHGSAESRENYRRTIAEWLAGTPAEAGPPASAWTVRELARAYYRHAKAYYTRNGVVGKEAVRVRQALRYLWRLYGALPAAAFGPKRGASAVAPRMSCAPDARAMVAAHRACPLKLQ